MQSHFSCSNLVFDIDTIYINMFSTVPQCHVWLSKMLLYQVLALIIEKRVVYTIKVFQL